MLFLDVSGFTSITEAASHKGRYGVELVTEVLNRHFNSVASIVGISGGEIYKYGGDSCLVIFEGSAALDQEQMQSVCRDLEASASKLAKLFKRKYNIRFGLHGSFCLGRYCIKIVGDPGYHLDYFVDGEAIKRAYQLAEGTKGIYFDASGYQNLPSQLAPDTELAPKRSRGFPYLAFLPCPVITKLKESSSDAELRNSAVVFIRLKPDKPGFIGASAYDTAFRRIQRFVYRYEGVVNKIDYTDKGYLIILLFGAPVPHRDDIERAFICATRISQINPEGFSLRIGINYSNIFVGKIGAKTRWEYGIIGNSVNIAARLMSHATDRQICVSDEIVPRISSKFETLFLTTTKLKGIRDQIGIHRLVRELPQEWSFYSHTFQDAPYCLTAGLPEKMVQELQQSSEALIKIAGDAGTGKSFLIWQICKLLQDKQLSYHLIPSDAYSQSLRLDFFYRSIRKKLSITSLSTDFDQLIGWMNDRGIKADAGILYRNLIRPEKLSPQQISQDTELVMSTASRILDLLYPASDILILDPIDHYDEQSTALIKLLIKRSLAQGGKVIITCRDASLWDWGSYYRTSTVELNKLDSRQSLRMVRHYLPLASEEAAHSLSASAGGNPAFLAELLGIVKKYLKSDDLITAAQIASLKARSLVPDSIENLMLIDLQGLDADLQQLIRLASIFAGGFGATDLAAICTSSPDELSGYLEQASSAGLLDIQDLVPYPIYSFRKPLLRQSVYNSILLADKAAMHHKLAKSYEADYLGGQKDALEKTAYHYIHTGKSVHICHWARVLAEHYMSVGALEQSKANWQLLAGSCKDKSSRQSAELSIAQILVLQADNDEAKAWLDRLKTLEKRPGPLRDRYLKLLAQYYNNSSQFPLLESFALQKLKLVEDEDTRISLRIQYLEMLAARSRIEEFISLAPPLFEELQSGNKLQAMSALSAVIAQAYMNQGYYRKAYTYYKKKSELSDKLQDPIGKRIGASGMGNALFRQGKKDDALRLYQVALNTAEESGDRNGYSKALLNIGTFHRNRGDYAAALDCYQKSMQVARQIGNLMQLSIIIYDIGELYSYKDQHDQALQMFEESLAIADKIGDESGKSFCYDAIGDNLFKRGLYPEAKATYLANLKLQERINDQEGIAHTYGNLGNLAKMDKNWDQARDFYKKQLEILTEVGDLDGSGRSWFNQAMIDIETGNLQAALPKLQNALKLFEKCNAQYYIDITLQQIEALDAPDKPTE